MTYTNRLSGFKAYKLHLAVRQHFDNDKYDIWVKKGRMYGTEEQFEARPDKSFFYSLGHNYLRGDLGNFYMANVMKGKSHVSEYEDFVFRDWKSVQHRIDYIFETDLKKLMGLGVEFRLLWETTNGGLPIALQALQGGHIHLETVCIVNILTKGSMVEKLDRKITDKFVYPSVRRRILKYQSWLRYDLEPLTEILKKNLSPIGHN